MLTNIKRAVNTYDMIREGDAVTVAVSGGADSVCLLYALKLLSEELGITLRACHVNHNLRGEESDSDEEYVRSLCKALEIPLDVFSVDVTGSVKKHESIEERARQLRYEAFQSLGTKIATAHTANDNTETVILNMLRGTGLKGLCGIPPVRGIFIRPLIFCTRAEIEDFCNQHSLRYVTDKTNLSTDYTRNKVRLEVIPVLNEINPSLCKGVERMTSALIEDSVFLENLAISEKEKSAQGEKYSCTSLLTLDDCILHRVISLILRENDIEPSSLRISGIHQILSQKKGKINLEKNKFAVVEKGLFSIELILQNYRNIIT